MVKERGEVADLVCNMSGDVSRVLIESLRPIVNAVAAYYVKAVELEQRPPGPSFSGTASWTARR